MRLSWLGLLLIPVSLVLFALVLVLILIAKRKKQAPPPAAVPQYTGMDALFCSKCGNQLATGSGFCNKCGAAIHAQVSAAADVPNTGLNVLSFFFPLIGFIVYGTSHMQAPRKAKAALKASIAGVVTWIVVGILGGLLPLLLF